MAHDDRDSEAFPAAEPFYVILREDDPRLHRHKALSLAQLEAKRLAGTAPGKRFFVLSVTDGYFLEDPVKRVKIRDEIPF